jgi:site-specific recombinase XerD
MILTLGALAVDHPYSLVGIDPDDGVFAREDGTDLSPGQVTTTFTRLSAAAGLRQVRLQDLGHGAASPMLAGGVDVAVVSQRMGHSSCG